MLTESGTAEVLPERDYAKILTIETAPEGLDPEVILLSHNLIIEYGLSLIPHLKDLLRAAVLVYGNEESLDVSAQVFAAGGIGYFVLTSPPHYLINAVSLAEKGKLWGPREAIELMARRAVPNIPQHETAPTADFSDDEVQLLTFLHEGLSNKEMALRLGVAEVTIKARLTKLYKKFGVNSRLQLLSAAIKRGLLDRPAATG